MRVVRTKEEKKPRPIPPELLGTCSLDQLQRQGCRFRMTIEIGPEKERHEVLLVQEADANSVRLGQKNLHVLTFREMKMAFEASRQRREAGHPLMTADEFFRPTDFAREHGLSTESVTFEEPCNSSSPS